MVLCDLCSGFDIRELLLQSAAQKPRSTGNTDRNFIDSADYRPPIPFFYKHRITIRSIKSAAAQNCSLCNLIWKTFLKTSTKPDVTDEWLDKIYQGIIYLGCSGWTISRQGLPYVTVIQQPSSGGYRSLCSFEAYAIQDEFPLDGHGLLGTAVFEDSASEECSSVAIEWLRECIENHQSCARSLEAQPAVLPTRVIAVGDSTTTPRLIISNGSRDRYLALSYCWGGNSFFVLNKHNSGDLMRGVPLNNFPATLRDAIIITRRLCIKYLWIDALCIQQDSSDDWAAEAAKMREVYAGALLTIAAANSPSTYAGIFSKRGSNNGRVSVEWKTDSKPSTRACRVYLRSGSDLWDNTLQSSPLMARGWTLQEGLLSPRTLSYGAQQMIWECCEYQADEGGRITLPTQDYKGKNFMQALVSPERKKSKKFWQRRLQPLYLMYLNLSQRLNSSILTEPYERWFEIVQQYTSRSLTKDTDTLPALSGLAREFQRMTGDTYCAGLWKNDIICGLLWDRLPVWSKDGSTRWDATKPSGYLAPSWSWAGVLGRQATLPNRRTRDAISKSAVTMADVCDVRTTLKGPDEFGQVISGSIVLKAKFWYLVDAPPITAEDFASEEFQVSSYASLVRGAGETSGNSAFQRLVHRNLRDTGRMEYEFLQQHVPCPDQRYAILEIVRWAKAPGSGVPGMEFLVLESTGNRDNEFRRIGMFGLRKLSVPDEDAVGPDAYAGTLAENEAWSEVMDSNWGRKTVTIV